METGVYVDILLALNYIINLLLITCAAKLAGRKPARRRIVAAALFGSASSLTIFLPFMGFWLSALTKLAVSSGMVFIAFKWMNVKNFFKELFIFFTVAFFFAGVMLAVWVTLSPAGMMYYNGIVYFNISALTLILTTAAAYLLLGLFHRLSQAGRIKPVIYRVHIHFGGSAAVVNGLVDTGNSLKEPFSGIPVIVCGFEEVKGLLPPEAAAAIQDGSFLKGESCGMALRGVPYSDVGGNGMLPAFRADKLELFRGGERIIAENAYVGISLRPVGDGSYGAVLNPDIAGISIT